MPFKEGREYRFSSPFNALPQDENNAYMVEGYATTFDQPYDFGRRGAKEMIASSAFAGADMSDVIFLYDHEGMVLARQRNKSLEIALDEHGMHVKAYLGATQKGRDLYEAIQSGLVDRMSWSFTVAEDGWEYDEVTRTATVTKVDKVYDVSAVSIPANEDTVIKARSYIDGAIDEGIKQQELLQSRQAEIDRLCLYLESIV